MNVSGAGVRELRRQLGWSQHDAARRWGVSQAYVSLVEQGKRPMPRRLAATLARRERRFATGLALETPAAGRNHDDLARRLGALGYPPFAYLGQARDVANPAAVVLSALTAMPLPTRVAVALPWVFTAFPDLHWPWLCNQAKLVNAQNRLGFLLALAMEHAPTLAESGPLAAALAMLDEARLFKEEPLAGSPTAAEVRYLTDHRSDLAKYWRVLTGLQSSDLRYDAPAS